MGWQPQVSKETGIRRLCEWVSSNKNLFATPSKGVTKSRAKEVRA
jgi:dTDP-D-glucose 4,6-dehydratase